MKMKLGLRLIVVFAWFVVVASVDAKNKPYFRVGAGMSLMNSADFQINGIDFRQIIEDATGVDPGPISNEGNFDVNPGVNIEAAVGTRLQDIPFLRVEMAGSFQYHDIEGIEYMSVLAPIDGNVALGTAMLNVYVDLLDPNLSRAENMLLNALHFYLLAGVGGGMCQWDLEGTSERDWIPVGSVGAGISYMASEKTSIDLQYKFLAGQNFEDETGMLEIDTSSHQFQIGVRVLL